MPGEQRRSHLVSHLEVALTRLRDAPFPPIASPSATKKRASIALIIRISPTYSHWPPTPAIGGPQDLSAFFAQEWVQHGTPEVLFIKRAARKGDRWTSHIALPGGKRDPEDADDLAAAIRETLEEVGLDISSSSNHYVLPCGNLPQRVVTTEWGKVPLMVLCPYVFLLTGHGGDASPPLKMQPTEVASCHWVPVSELLSPANRTVKEEDVSNRFARQEVGLRRVFVRAMIGQMVFSAIQLRPSESLSCVASPAENVDGVAPSSRSRWPFAGPRYDTDPPLLLWGLTLGVLADFLDMLPPHNAFKLWSYPTFTPWDIRTALSLLSYRFRRRKALELEQIKTPVPKLEAVELGLEAVPLADEAKLSVGGIHGMSTGLNSSDINTRLRTSAVSDLLDGYYDIIRRAVTLVLVGRVSVALGTLTWLVLRWKRNR